MKNTTTTTTDPGVSAMAASLALATVLGEGLVLLLVHGLALAVVLAERLAGRQLIHTGQETAATPVSSQAAQGTGGQSLDALTVRELRSIARSAGHRALARSGRKSDLLAALA